MASSIPLEDHELEWWHEPEEESQDVTTPPRAAKAFALEDVDWADDKQHPDYRHLDTSFPDQEFELTAADLELIIRENRFEPAREEDRILFGLRGAMLVGGSSAKGPTLRVRLNRPNHREFRCIIGVYDTSTKQLSGFVGSTVPWYAYVYDYYTRGRGDPKTNLLPTGCYPYFVGPHGKHQIPGCFRLGTGHDKEQQERVAVLRTLYDVRYDTSDIFDPSIPHDNLHPSFGGKMFRSRGCQTVRGSYDTGHTGEWAEFRTAAGLGNRGDNGKRFDYLLVTGVEAAIASKLRTTGLVANSSVVLEHLTRLRHGSRGELVSSLQRKLGLTPNGNFGAQETRALAALQRKKFSFADGIYSPAIDTGLQYNILKSAPAAPQPVRHIAVDSRRIALVIGNGAYTGAQALGNPVGDAHAIAEKLKQLNFSVTLLPDASERALVQGIVKFKDDLTACHVGLIFYAGHGVQIDGENYVLPVDCNPATQAELRQSSVALSTLLEPLEESGKVGIIILDCCRDNPFRGRAVSRSLRRGFANLGAPAGTFIAFSTQPGATAADGEPGKHSPFATSLLQHITSEDVEIDKLMRQVRKEVNEKTEGRQLPWDQSSLMVDHFAFKQSSRGVEQRVLTREELDKQQKEDSKEREDEYWTLTSRSNSEELLESFIAQYPDSRFRSEADDKLAAIRAEAARVKARARRRELQFRGLIVGTVLLGAVVLGLWLGNRYVSDLNRDLRNWQALAFKGQFKLFLAKARDKLDGDSPDEARAQMLAAYRIFKERGKELDRQLRVDFSNVVTESLKQDGDVSLEQSAGVQPKSTQAAFTPDGKQIVWAENGQGKLLNISDAQNGRLLAQQPRYANNVRTVITSPDGTHAALLSEIGDAELFFIGGGRFPDYYSVYRENDLRAITFSSGAPLLAAVDKNGDIFGWRFSAKGELLAGTEKLSGAAPLERDEPTGAGFAISCFEYLCVWATPDGRAHAARLGAKPGSDWKHLQGSSKLEGWSSSGPPYIRLGKNQLFVYAGENLVLYEVGAKQDTFKLKSVHTWRLPALVSLEIDAQERLAAIYAPDKTFSGWTVTYLELIQKNAKLELNPTYSRDFEREIIDFNWPTKSVIFAPLPRAGLDVLKRRADTGALHEHNCSPSCNVINWLGASDRTVVGVNRTKLDNVESGGFAYQLRLGDADF